MVDKLRDEDDGIPRHRGHDPLEYTRRESLSFNRMWLKNGERLTPVQRTGFAIFSLMFCAGGVFLADGSLMSIDDGANFFAFFMGIGSIFFLVFGLLRLRNILRFAVRHR
jgi:hypothetical protein